MAGLFSALAPRPEDEDQLYGLPDLGGLFGAGGATPPLQNLSGLSFDPGAAAMPLPPQPSTPPTTPLPQQQPNPALQPDSIPQGAGPPPPPDPNGPAVQNVAPPPGLFAGMQPPQPSNLGLTQPPAQAQQPGLLSRIFGTGANGTTFSNRLLAASMGLKGDFAGEGNYLTGIENTARQRALAAKALADQKTANQNFFDSLETNPKTGKVTLNQGKWTALMRASGVPTDPDAMAKTIKDFSDGRKLIHDDKSGDWYWVDESTGEMSRSVAGTTAPTSLELGGKDNPRAIIQQAAHALGPVTGPDGQPIAPAAAPDAPAADVPAAPAAPAAAAFNAAVGRREATGQNPYSSANGVGQFLGKVDPTTGVGKGTWFDVMRGDPQFAKDIAGKSDAQILAMRSDPDIGNRAIQSYAAMNTPVLQRLGVANPDAAALGMAHGYGPGGAAAILKAPPDTPMPQIIGPHTALINRVANKTAGQVVQDFQRRFGGAGAPGPAALAAAAPAATGAAVPTAAVAPATPAATQAAQLQQSLRGYNVLGVTPPAVKDPDETPRFATAQEKIEKGLDPNVPIQIIKGVWKPLNIPGYNARAKLQDAMRASQTNDVINQIDEISKYAKAHPEALGWGATGAKWRANSYAQALEIKVEGLKSAMNIGELNNMRAMSPRGGAFGGNTSTREVSMLGSSVANLKTTDREFLNNLQSARSHYTNWQTMLKGAAKEGVTSFFPDSGDVATAQAGQGGTPPPAATAAAPPAARPAAQRAVPVRAIDALGRSGWYDPTTGRQVAAP